MAIYQNLIVPVFLLELCIILSSSFNITLLHTNDCHTRFVETDQSGGVCTTELKQDERCFGGVARRSTLIKEICTRDPDENVLLLDAGDQFQGSDWFYVYKGNATSHFMNILGYDAMVLGNHEFDNGISGVVPFLNNVSFPVLSCNIDAANEPRLQGLFVCNHVFIIRGEKVGVVGYTLQSTPDFAKTEQLIFNEEIPAVQDAVTQLTQTGINKIIALGHAGFDIDQEVARSVEGVDIVVGGHSNTFLYTGDAPSNQEPAGEYPYIVHPTYDETAAIPVVTAYAYGKYLGYLEVTFDDSGEVTGYNGNPIMLDNNVEPDPDIQTEVDEWNIRVQEVSNTVIGSTEVALNGNLQTCGTQECNLGNMLADAMVSSNGMGWDEDSIGMTTSGSIISSLNKGDITIGDIILVMPYGNTIDRVRLRGDHLLQVLEVPMTDFDPTTPTYDFLQVSGLKIEYDLIRESGNRVLRAQFLCVACTDDGANQYMDIDPDSVYNVIMNSYMTGGGGGYAVIKENKIEHISGNSDIDVTMVYVQTASPLTTGIEGRIVIYDADYRPGAGHALKPIVTLILALSVTAISQVLR